MSFGSERIEGGCACGQVRYLVKAMPFVVHACHCSLCQTQIGGPHAVNALLEAENVELLSGQLEKTTVPTPSGSGQVIVRCQNCKVAVWSSYLKSPRGEKLRFLRVGTLDIPALMPPDVHIHTSAKVPWYVIPPDHYAVDSMYERGAVWSEDARQRYEDWVAAMA